MIEFIRENWGLSILFGVVFALLVLLLVVGLTEEIPNCKICGQPEYHSEFSHFQPVINIVNGIPVTTLIPIYKSVNHVCSGKGP